VASRKNTPPIWLFYACNDYAAARCLLFHGLMPGFVLAQQAVEKLLKSFLQHAYPGTHRFIGKNALKPTSLPVNASHDLVAHAELVTSSFPSLDLTPLVKNRELLERLSYLYDQKYPDSDIALSHASTAWLHALDELFVPVALVAPVEASQRWRTGLYASAWPLALPSVGDHPNSHWTRHQNAAFSRALPDILASIHEGHRAALASSSAPQ
jgi:hypothetical protein